MSRWLRRARHLPAYALSGAALTLFMAWAVPLLLAARGLGPSASSTDLQRLVARSSHPLPEESGDPEMDPVIEVRRSIFSDWCVVDPADAQAGSASSHLWPTTLLTDRLSPDASPRSAPTGCILGPPEVDRDRYARIDTILAGWPFRAFAGEAWFTARVARTGGSDPGPVAAPGATSEAASDDGPDHDLVPEYRWSVYIGEIGGRQSIVSLRPLWLGLIADLLFWTGLSWVAVAIPATLRRRKREKYGKCVQCGEVLDPTAARRPERCPSCAAPLPRDPLAFARSPEMHYQNMYTWFVFVSSLDIMLTWKILDRGGLEVNPIAKLVIDAWGMHGAIAFKFALMLWVIVACELLARMKRSAGKFLATCAVIVSASPVVWSLFLILWHELVAR